MFDAKEANRKVQRAFRERMRALGYAEIRGAFAHKDDHERIKAYIKKLNRKRAK